MAVELEGTTYLTAGELADQIGVSRQTLWRWRQEGKVPIGYRYRDRQLLFTEDDYQVVRGYAHRLQPATPRCSQAAVAEESGEETTQ